MFQIFSIYQSLFLILIISILIHLLFSINFIYPITFFSLNFQSISIFVPFLSSIKSTFFLFIEFFSLKLILMVSVKSNRYYAFIKVQSFITLNYLLLYSFHSILSIISSIFIVILSSLYCKADFVVLKYLKSIYYFINLLVKLSIRSQILILDFEVL